MYIVIQFSGLKGDLAGHVERFMVHSTQEAGEDGQAIAAIRLG